MPVVSLMSSTVGFLAAQCPKKLSVGGHFAAVLKGATMVTEDEQAFIDEVRFGGYEGEITVCKDLDTVVLS